MSKLHELNPLSNFDMKTVITMISISAAAFELVGQLASDQTPAPNDAQIVGTS